MDATTRLILEALMTTNRAQAAMMRGLADHNIARGAGLEVTLCEGRAAAIENHLRTDLHEERAAFAMNTVTRKITVNKQAELLVVIEAARAAVSTAKPSYGFGDVGDAVVKYLRREATADETLQRLSNLAEDYAHFAGAAS